MNILKTDSWKITLPDGIVIDSKNLEVTKISNESDRIKPPRIKFSVAISDFDPKPFEEYQRKLFKDHIKNVNDRRNAFIESSVYRYMSIKRLFKEDMMEYGLHLVGPGWDEYRYKDDLIIRVDTELNWDEGSVGYRYSINECMK